MKAPRVRFCLASAMSVECSLAVRRTFQDTRSVALTGKRGPGTSASQSSQCRAAQKKDVVAESRRHRALHGRCALQKSLRTVNTHTACDEPPRGGPSKGGSGSTTSMLPHTQQARGGGRWTAFEQRTPRRIFRVRDTRNKTPERCPTLHGRLPDGPHVSRWIHQELA